MNFKTITLIVLLLLSFTFFSCGEDNKDSLYLDGRVFVETDNTDLDPISSVFVAVSKTMDYDSIQKDPLDNIIEIALVGSWPQDFLVVDLTGEEQRDFSIDLTECGVKAGEEIYIFAFIDNGYESGIPNIAPGDILGFYIGDNFDLTYELQPKNNFVEININRTVYDFEASVTGQVLTHEPGDVILVAYAGEINSVNFNDIDIDGVIGYKIMENPTGSATYTLDILPYGYDVPIDNVYIFAFLDKNGNGTPDDGDYWGSAYDDEGYPVTITITDNSVTNLDLLVDHEITSSSGQEIFLQGSFVAPEEYDKNAPPVFMIVCQADNPNEIFENTIDTVKYFEKLPLGETTFDLDLSDSGLKAGDEVMIIAMWDRDYVSGFPRLSEDDMIGYYINDSDYSYQYTLKEGVNSGISINLAKTYQENDASVEGTILGSDAGKVVVVAYTGEFESYDISLNTDKIIGYQEMTKGASPASYSMDIMPFVDSFPVENVYIFAFLDNNDNGKPDGGDKWGCYTDSDGYPVTINLINGLTTGIDISIDNEITESAGYDISLQGSFDAPAEYGTGSAPVFMIVCQADNPNTIFEDTMSTVKYFEKLPLGQTTFDLDLSNAGLAAGSEVMIIAMWDRDWVSGFPRLSEGDMIGYYINESDYSYQYTLKEGVNSGISINLNKTYEENSASVQGTILGNESGKVIVAAYTGDFDSYDISLDSDEIIGYEEFTKDAVPTAYSMDILPFVTFPVEDVYIFAFLDNNNNGTPDGGDKWGSYNDVEGYPVTVDLYNSVVSGIDISIDNEISEPTGYSISLQGSFDAPAGYATSSSPVFMVVCQADDPEEIFEDTMSTVKYFEKLPLGQTTFDLDLSGTDLVPGDEVMIIALWDRDYVSGFPYLSEGDMIGYYINQEDYQFQYALADGVNSGISISLCHTYQENSATVQGNILGDESGDVIIIAYTGEFNSLDTTLDTDEIVGYQKITKGTSSTAYSMDLLPFVTFPLEEVFIFAILDRNQNGTPDSGDLLGFYTDNDNGIPSLATLQNSANTGYDVEFLMNYIDSSSGGTTMTLSGSITAPSGYTTSASTKPIFIIIASAENTFEIFNDPMSVIKYFVRLPQGSTSYNIDLSGTGIEPGDEIRIMALWDRNFTAGFPSPDEGDKIGYYQNKSDFSFSIEIDEGANYANLTNGWSFGINKTLYDHDARLSFKFEQKTSEGDLDPNLIRGKDVLVVTIYEAGVDDDWNFWNLLDPPSYGITDMDYITTIDYLTIPDTSTWQNNTYTVGFFPFIYDNISLSTNPLRMNKVYIYAILDENGNGWPDTGEYVGFYWTWYWFNKIPAKYSTVYYDRVNTLPNGEVVTIMERTY
ncbi:MAG TPA: hypothetical protein PK926_13845 [Spirochaetota bacterium]|nr:hypothetical protein [Spirochaetota bacterium]HPI88657.1 hypothetical protein [Spirochaetota bacterium]HPR49098.1 hypothetical protein [Spirochaetota bacterium]